MEKVESKLASLDGECENISIPNEGIRIKLQFDLLEEGNGKK